MHYETNIRTLLLTFIYMPCIIIIVTCESPITSSETLYPSTEKPVQPNVSNNYITSRRRLDSSDTPTDDKPVFYEGGSTSPDKTEKNDTIIIPRTSTPKDSLNRKILELESLPYGLKDSNPTDIKPHKGRKGVEIEDTNSEETPTDKPGLSVFKTTDSGKKLGESLNNTIPRTVTSTVNSTTEIALNLPAVNSQIVKQELMVPVNISSNENAFSRSSQNETIQNVTTANKYFKAPKPITRDDGDIDNSSYSLTATESDYIIPIVATIFAAPLLIVLGMFLYKRSKEFWERRHYRRMDFLIDGMYND